MHKGAHVSSWQDGSNHAHVVEATHLLKQCIDAQTQGSGSVGAQMEIDLPNVILLGLIDPHRDADVGNTADGRHSQRCTTELHLS